MNLRFYWLYLKALILRHLKIISLVLFLTLIFFFLLFKLSSFITSQLTQPLSIGLVGNFTESELPSEVANLLSWGLTKIDSAGRAQPSLAQNWEIKDEGKEYIFTLNKNVFWHDGKTVKASDLKFNFSDIQTEVLNDETLKFRLKDPLASFATILAKPLFKNGSFVGTGPYKLVNIEKKGEIFKKLTLNSQVGRTRLVFYFYSQEDLAKTALKLGEIQILKLQNSRINFENAPNLKSKFYPNPHQFLGLFFNTKDPLLSQKFIRQALAYGLPDELKEATTSPISYNSWVFNREVRFYQYDVKRVKELLEKRENEAELKITLTTVPLYEESAQKIKKSWEELGIKTNAQIVQAVPSNFQALLIAQEIPADPDQYSLWHSTQLATNITSFSSARIDKLLEDGRRIQNEEERKKIYQDFQKILVEEVPAVFLSYSKVNLFYYKRVEKQVLKLENLWP